MTRPKSPSWAISKDHLPPDVQPHVPDDLDSAQLAFWWAAFAKGVASVEEVRPRYEPDHDYRMPSAPDMLKAVKAEVNYGDPIEATADATVGRVELLMGHARALAPDSDDNILDRALFQSEAVVKFRDGESGPEDPRLVEALVANALGKAGVIKEDNW